MVFCSVTQFIFSFPGSGFVDERKEAYVLSVEQTFNNGAIDEDTEGYLCQDEMSFKCDKALTQCISRDLKCNGVPECRNGRDESVEQCGCQPNEFMCNMTHCIDILSRCDLKSDCEDGSDEDGCETYQCPVTHIKCQNHFCVPRDVVCDFVNDCGDNSDEIHCDPRTCYPTEFRCNNSECVTVTYICDGQADCKDGSDELPEFCKSYFRCPIGLYIHSSQVCDGWEDCIFTHADEFSCSGTGSCADTQFRCKNSRCIDSSAVCNGICDCIYDCEDENDCPSYGCDLDKNYLCRNNRCIPKELVCDGHNDCKNTAEGQDEYFCLNENTTTCADLPFGGYGLHPVQCGTRQCMPEVTRCDHYKDCLDGTDEEDCGFESKSCAKNEFRCDNHQCIPASAMCDGKINCADASDEKNCHNLQCPAETRKCKNGQCVLKAKWCDHQRDCLDGSDESGCRPEDYRQCSHWEFRCSNGQCVDRDLICYDGHNASGKGCLDKSNLMNCSLHKCKEGQFKCRNSYCIDETQKCDGRADCVMTLLDEQECLHKCPYHSEECLCEEEKLNCSHRNLTELPVILKEEPYSKFHLSGNRLNLTQDTFAEFKRMTYLDLSNNALHSIPLGCFSVLFRLVYLNLENNNLHEMTNGTFLGLSNLKTLFLGGNRIRMIYPDAFAGLSALTSLDLSNQNLNKIPQKAFLGLRQLLVLNLSFNVIETVENGAFNALDNLLTLDLSHNIIVVVEKNVFHGMGKLATLYTDEFRFCCLARDVPRCYPEPDEFSSCEDLMSNYVLRISIWVLGMVASFGNLLVIGWRARDLRGGKVHSFLITNLAIGDFFMGVYLLIIAVVDSYYRGVYILYDRMWRNSDLCRFSGFISTFSSELSVFTLTVITLDRLICIIFPLKLKRLGLKQATVVMATVWAGVFVMSVLPLLDVDYFREFYGRSGVCLALHVTPDRPPGWEYSIAVFLVLNFASFILICLSYLWMFFIAKQTRSAVRASESKNDAAMARRMTLIVMTDFCCWVPIILLGFASLGGARSSNDVYAWIAVFVLPLNSAINPVLYTISTAPFLGNVRKRANRFRKSFISSFTLDNTKQSYVDDRTSNSYYDRDRKSQYRHMDLIRMRSLNKSPLQSHSESDL